MFDTKIGGVRNGSVSKSSHLIFDDLKYQINFLGKFDMPMCVDNCRLNEVAENPHSHVPHPAEQVRTTILVFSNIN